MTATPNMLSVDFAALDVLCRLHATGSFTRTAEALGVNQSAVSYRIDKLRQVFGDPLFVKEAGRQVPTRRCDAIVAGARGLLEDYRALALPEAFDPASARADVTIACNYYERLLLIPTIARHLRDIAPGIRLTVTNASSDGPQRLIDDEADLLLGPLQEAGSGVYAERLFDDHYLCLADAGHPCAGSAPSLETYLSLDHILITYDGSWKSRYLQELEAMGHRLQAAMRVPSPAGVAQLVSGTRLVATVPARLGNLIGTGQGRFACPVPAPFPLGLTWTARTHSSALHRWLRTRIAQLVRREMG